MTTPMIGKRKAAEVAKKSEFEAPASKRPKKQVQPPVEATPLRDQMRLNQEVAMAHSEAWEKSSIYSGFTSSYGGAGG